MKQLSNSVLDIFNEHCQQDTLIQSITQLDCCHSQMHEFSEPVDDCRHKIAKLNRTCSHFTKPFLHVVYIDSAVSGGRVVSAAPYISEKLKSACYIASDLMEPTQALDKLLRENLCGNKRVVPDVDEPRWNRIKEDFDGMQRTIHDNLCHVMESASMAVEDFTPAQLDDLERDLRRNVSHIRQQMTPSWNKQLLLRSQISHDGNIAEAAREMLGEMENDFSDSLFIDYYKSRNRSFKELACFMRQHIDPSNDQAANEFVTYLAYHSFLDDIHAEPTSSIHVQNELHRCIHQLIRSDLWRQAEADDTLADVVAIAGSILFSRNLIKRYGTSGFSVPQWEETLRLNFNVKNLDVRNINRALQPYRDDLGQGRFDRMQADNPLWHKISSIMEKR